MKAYKIVVLFLDHDDIGPDEAAQLIENARLPNHIIPGTVMSVEMCDIGEWDDEHPLNTRGAKKAMFDEMLFTAVRMKAAP